MTDDDEFWSNRFHWCALAAGFLAASEDRIGDSRHVQQLAYELYEGGAFRERAASKSLTCVSICVSDEPMLTKSESRNATEEESHNGACCHESGSIDGA